MFVKTRIPKDANCIVLGGKNASEAFCLKSLFAEKKKGARIITMPELIEARIKYGFKHPIWESGFTTPSTEWVGLDEHGELVIVVLHTLNPELESKLLEASVKSRKGASELYTIERGLFLDVCAGKYGPVIRVPFEEALQQKNSNTHRYGFLRRDECRKNQLLCARLGASPEMLNAYFDMHEEGSRDENSHCWQLHEENQVIMRGPLSRTYHPTFTTKNVRGPYKLQTFDKTGIDLETSAAVHFIMLGSKSWSSDARITAASLGEPTSSLWFLVSAGAIQVPHFRHKIPMYTLGNYREHLLKLFVENQTDIVPSDFFQVERQEGGWFVTIGHRDFVQTGRETADWFVSADPTFLASGRPEFMVNHLQPVGRRTLNIPKKRGRFTYGDVRELFPNSGANAFQVLGGGFKKRQIKGKPFYSAVIEYYDADVRASYIIPTEKEIVQDMKLLGRIV